MGARAKGDAYERSRYEYLRAAGFEVVRVHDGGIHDEGDLRVFLAGRSIAVQAKNFRSLADAINAALRDLPAQVANAGADLGVALCRRHGKPDPADDVVVARLGDLVEVAR